MSRFWHSFSRLSSARSRARGESRKRGESTKGAARASGEMRGRARLAESPEAKARALNIDDFIPTYAGTLVPNFSRVGTVLELYCTQSWYLGGLTWSYIQYLVL